MFTSDLWRQSAKAHGSQQRTSRVKVHICLGICERLHDRLRRIYNKILHHFPHVQKYYVLNLTVKEMDDTLGDNGIVPSRLVFGILARFPILNFDLPSQNERVGIIKIARAENTSIIVESTVLVALTSYIPPAANGSYELGKEELVYFHSEING